MNIKDVFINPQESEIRILVEQMPEAKWIELMNQSRKKLHKQTMEILSLPVEAQVSKNLAGGNEETLTEWRHILLSEKRHKLLIHIIESGLKQGTLGNEETIKLLGTIKKAERHNYYIGRRLTKAKLEKLTKFIQERY